jgi:hypothetical protein
VSAAWVAGSVRASAMTRRCLGWAATRTLAGCSSSGLAVAQLADSSYGHDVRAGQSLADAQRAAVATVLWNLRVLSGWQPRDGVVMLRALLGAVEAANVGDHLQRLSGVRVPPPFQLGGLATAWPRLAATTSVADLRRALAASPWGDPGGDTPREIALTMRLALADRIMREVPVAGEWAAGAAALLLAREVASEHRELSDRTRLVASRVVGPAAVSSAVTLPDFVGALSGAARWALADVDGPAALWRSEAAWWTRVGREGAALCRHAGPGPQVLVGAVAVMAVDAWRVRAALEMAARGGGRLEVFDAVA